MQPDSLRRELVVVAIGGLGDILLLTPFIRHFRETGRYHRIVCLCSPRAVQLLDCNPFVDEVISCEANERLFWAIPQENREVFSPYRDISLNAEPSGEVRIAVEGGFNPGHGRRPAIEAIARHARIRIRSRQMEVFTTEADQVAASEIYGLGGGRPAVLVGFESLLTEKNLPVKIRREIRVRLRRAGLILFEVSGHTLRIGKSHLPLPALRTMSELAKLCSAILTVDSFLGHLAGAVGTPAVVLFGPSNPAIYGHPTNRNLRPSLCPPCAGSPRRRECNSPHCMSAFRSDLIAHATIKAAHERAFANLPGRDGL